MTCEGFFFTRWNYEHVDLAVGGVHILPCGFAKASSLTPKPGQAVAAGLPDLACVLTDPVGENHAFQPAERICHDGSLACDAEREEVDGFAGESLRLASSRRMSADTP